MKRGLWLIFGALALLAAGILFSYEPDRLTQVEPPAVELPDVRVQHEFVQIPAAAASTAPLGQREERSGHAVSSSTQRMTGRAVSSAASGRTTVERAARNPTLLEKARRAFVGDGRHRPEPFPRVR